MLIAGLVGGAASATPPTCTASSGEKTAVLVELYTSEGCSSCPPADKWLSRLKGEHIVPLALHVDYWNDLGWRDRFSNPQFTRRQTDIAQRSQGKAIYTPQIAVNGKDFRNWRDADSFSRSIGAITARPAQAQIRLATNRRDNSALQVSFEGQVLRRHGRAAAYLAIYENGLESKVASGENKGAVLRHDRVVRAWFGPVPIDSAGHVALKMTIDHAPGMQLAQSGVSAFIQDLDSGEILQALALPFCTG